MLHVIGGINEPKFEEEGGGLKVRGDVGRYHRDQINYNALFAQWYGRPRVQGGSLFQSQARFGGRIAYRVLNKQLYLRQDICPYKSFMLTTVSTHQSSILGGRQPNPN